MKILKINKELKDLIPPLQKDEYNLLEKSLLDEGCRDKLIIWDGVIIDGHNRYEICTKHNIPFEVEDREFENIEAVKLWMIDNQNGRRNLTDGWKWELAQCKKSILLERGRENLKTNVGNNQRLSIVDKGKEHNTQNEIAKDLGWSTGKVAMADKVWKEAKPEVKEKIKAGETSINQAYQEIKKEERKKDIERQKRDIEIAQKNQPEKTNKKYTSIVLDPPWMYGRAYDPKGSRVANPYPEMSQEQLKKLEIPAMDDSIMFLWTTHKFLFDAKELMDHWGFDYKATLVWNKEKIGMGHWFRMQCEFCLFGIKGKPFWDNTSIRDIITEPRREHSRKPEAFYDMVEAVSVGEIYEFFARTERERFVSFGNETNKFTL